MATPNFCTQDNFPLYASANFDPYEVTDEETGETYYEDGDIFSLRELEQRIDEFNDTLTYYTLTIKDGHYSGVQAFLKIKEHFNEEMILTDDYTAEEWHKARIEKRKYPYSYYSWDFELSFSTQKRAEQRERAKIIKFCKTILKEYGFDEYGISARFSNGETWYSKVYAPNITRKSRRQLNGRTEQKNALPIPLCNQQEMHGTARTLKSGHCKQ